MASQKNFQIQVRIITPLRTFMNSTLVIAIFYTSLHKNVAEKEYQDHKTNYKGQKQTREKSFIHQMRPKMNGKLLVFCAENYNKTILLKAFTTFSTSCALPRLCHREMNYLEADTKVSKRLYTFFAPYPLYVAKWLFFHRTCHKGK